MDVIQNNKALQAMRIIFKTVPIEHQGHGAKVMTSIRTICKEFAEEKSLNFTPFSMEFLFYDQVPSAYEYVEDHNIIEIINIFSV